jgi:hypothetical protein
VAVDGAGDVFIADYDNSRVVEVPAGGGPQTTVGSGLNFPIGVTVDGAGDVFIADTYNNQVVEVQSSQAPSLSFAATAVGGTSSDSPQSVTIQNIGNQPLDAVAPGLVVGGPNFLQVAGLGTPADCTSAFALTPGATCNLSISFEPQSGGNLTSAATFTDSALNTMPSASQGIALKGTGQTGSVATTTTLVSSPEPSTYNQSVTFTATVMATGGGTPTGTVTFTDSGNFLGMSSLNGGGSAALSTSTLGVGGHYYYRQLRWRQQLQIQRHRDSADADSEPGHLESWSCFERQSLGLQPGCHVHGVGDSAVWRKCHGHGDVL